MLLSFQFLPVHMYAVVSPLLLLLLWQPQHTQFSYLTIDLVLLILLICLTQVVLCPLFPVCLYMDSLILLQAQVSHTQPHQLQEPSHCFQATKSNDMEKLPLWTHIQAQTHFEDWLPTLTRAATWNLWSDEECMMQLANHLRGRALVEWNLLSSEEKLTFTLATEAL